MFYPDILGAVNDFVLKYVQRPDLPVLTQNQIVRGWQNVVQALPNNSQSFCVLTLLGSVRHGTNVICRENAVDPFVVTDSVYRLAEHSVQVDFCSARPEDPETVSRLRAEIVETLTRSLVAVEFFKPYNLTACYADDVQSLPYTTEDELYSSRYSVTMHLSGWTKAIVNWDAFSDVDLRIENVDVHHPLN